MEVSASAPGKLFLLGEYAVALGEPAIVTAVDRRLGCRLRQSGGSGRFSVTAGSSRHQGSLDDEQLDGVAEGCRYVVAALLVGVRHLGLRGVDLEVDTWSDLDDAVDKVGLGGSAAIVAAVLAGLHELCGRGTDAVSVAELGVAAHRFAQGGGSGADVVACTLGGIRRIEVPDARKGNLPACVSDCAPVKIATQPIRLPGPLRFRAVGTDTSASTGPRVRRFLRWAAGEGRLGDAGASLIEAWAEGMTETVRAFEDACRSDSPGLALRSVSHGRDLFDKLGAVAGIPVWSPRLRLACDAGVDVTAAAIKPSGAGGGDCAVALVRREASLALETAWKHAGLRPLTLRANAQGVLARAEPGRDVDG